MLGQAVMLLLSSLYVASSLNTSIIHESRCFGTVTHSYSNPQVTGQSVLQFTYKNDGPRDLNVTLSCNYSHLVDHYIEVLSVELLLPSSDESDSYCVESKNTDFRQCTSQKQCDCCEKPTELCRVSLAPDAYSQCNNKKTCNLTVTSRILNDCPGRKYECESKKCHSRWVDVSYLCQEINTVFQGDNDVTTVQPGLHIGIHIGIAVAGVCLVLVVIVIIWCVIKRRCRTGQNDSKRQSNPPNATESDDYLEPIKSPYQGLSVEAQENATSYTALQRNDSTGATDMYYNKGNGPYYNCSGELKDENKASGKGSAVPSKFDKVEYTNVPNPGDDPVVPEYEQIQI